MEGFNDNSEQIVGAKQNTDGSLDTSKAMKMIEGEEKETISYLDDARRGIEMLITRVGQGGLTDDQLLEIRSKASEIFNAMHDLGVSAESSS